MTPPRRQRVMSPQMRAALGLPASGLAADGVQANGLRPDTPSADTPSADRARAQAPHAAVVPALPALAITLRVQRRLANRTMSVLLAGLLLGPLLLAVLPGLAEQRVGPVPIVWIVLGVLAYPALLILAQHHRRAVDRLEAELAHRDSQA